MRRRAHLSVLALACLNTFWCATPPAYAQSADPNAGVDAYTAVGINAGRSHSFSLDDVSTVDPFTGVLHVGHTDVQLEGTGPAIRIGRSYNTNSRVPGLAGDPPLLRMRNLMAAGWDFHMGYMTWGNGTASCDTPISHPLGIPTLVSSDGSRHGFYQPAPESTSVHHYIAKGGWVADCLPLPDAGYRVRSPDGTAYIFDQEGVVGQAFLGGSISNILGYQLTRIEDMHGNTVIIEYNAQPGLDEPNRVIASDGREVRLMYEAYTHGSEGGARRLREVQVMSGATVGYRYTYTYAEHPGNASYSQLTRVDGPEGLTWRYAYQTQGPGIYELERITNPWGATKRFSYDYKTLPAHLGSLPTLAVSHIELFGPGVPSAEWDYAYGFSSDPGTWWDITTIRGPAHVEVHTFCGERAVASPDDDSENCGYRTGTIQSIERYGRTPAGRGPLLERESYTWLTPRISAQWFPVSWLPNMFIQEAAPRRESRTVERGGMTFRTEWAGYGWTTFLPTAVSEFFNEDRSRARQVLTTYYEDLANWIIKPETEVLLDMTYTDPFTNTSVQAGENGITRSFNAEGEVVTEQQLGRTNTFLYRADGTPSFYSRYGAGGEFDVNAVTRGVPTSITSRGTGRTLSRTLTGQGFIRTETDWEGNTTTLQYDDLGRVISVETPRPDDHDMVVTYDFGLRQESFTRGPYSEITRRDGLGRVTEVDQNGIVVRTEYDGVGRVVFVSDPIDTTAVAIPAACVSPSASNYCAFAQCDGRCTTYDALGRPISEVYTRDQSGVTLDYPSPVQTRTTDALGHVTTVTHERWGDPDEERPILIEQEEGVTTEIVWYRSGRPFSVEQNAGGAFVSVPRQYLVNADGQLSAELHPEFDWRRYAYDLRGRLSQNWFHGPTDTQNRIFYLYDAADRLLSRGPAAASEKMTYTYDDNHRIVTESAPDNPFAPIVRTYSYDENGNVTAEELAIANRNSLTGEVFRFPIVRVYDGNDNLDRLVYPSTRTVHYAPDAFGRPTQAAPHVTRAAYHPNGTLSQINYANGHVVSLSPDGDKPWLVDSISGGPVGLSYEYDAVGNVRAIADSAVPGNDVSLVYDRLNRLTSASGRWGTIGYVYDVKNNLQQKTINGQTIDFTYGYERTAPAGQYYPHRLETTSGFRQFEFQYDKRGHVVAASDVRGAERREDQINMYWYDRALWDDHWEYREDCFDDIFSLEMNEYRQRRSHRYDAAGNRTWSALSLNGTNDTGRVYVYSGDRLLYEEDRQLQAGKETVYLGALAVAQVIERCDGDITNDFCTAFSRRGVEPRVAILEPQHEDSAVRSEAVTLRAVAFHPTLGDVSGELDWYLMLGGEATEQWLADGGQATVSRLPIGQHRIEARWYDPTPNGHPPQVHSVRFDVTTGPNAPPVPLVGSLNFVAPAGQPMTEGPIADWFDDPDGDPLTFSLVSAPDWVVISGPNLFGVAVSTTPDATFQIVASDGIATSEPITVHVTVQ